VFILATVIFSEILEEGCGCEVFPSIWVPCLFKTENLEDRVKSAFLSVS